MFTLFIDFLDLLSHDELVHWNFDEEIIIETLSCFKRAGADAILTYFAMDAAKILSKS